MSGEHESKYVPKTAIERWLDVRLPIVRLGYDSAIAYPTPRNLNYWWTFGGILTVVLVSQILTGVILAMQPGERTDDRRGRGWRRGGHRDTAGDRDFRKVERFEEGRQIGILDIHHRRGFER